eukprot:14410789-Ditylum_brightwellii.AAC.1
MDPTTINGFNPNKHIGMEFIHMDKKGVPTIATIMEVNEETGKVILEYMHGGLEMVEPNIIQEALLSREQHDDANKMWTFLKILNHWTEDKGKIEVEVLWDNGEMSWEPLVMLRKDDPIIIAAYAKERKLLEQRRWKWAKHLAVRKKKLARLLKIMKASK